MKYFWTAYVAFFLPILGIGLWTHFENTDIVLSAFITAILSAFLVGSYQLTVL